MHRHFCTLFDSKYAAKGLALHESLLKHSSEPFSLDILALDAETFWLLDELKLAHVKITPLEAFEHAMHMWPVRESRSWQEYAWTCASSFMEFLMGFPDIDALTYLDSDLWFMSDPKVVFDEIGHKSIGIIPHRFIPSKRYLERNGRFNVGFVYIRNNEIGKRCIERWAAQVREWCYNRIEGRNACGDQKYLDEFEKLYGDECCTIENIGANLAPWNLANYRITNRDGHIYADSTSVVFYHFHEYVHAKRLTNYELRSEDMLIYDQYIRASEEANGRIGIAFKAIDDRRAVLALENDRA